MARDFDGTNDKGDMGTDTSIDEYVTRTIAFWIRLDTLPFVNPFNKSNGSSNGFDIFINGSGIIAITFRRATTLGRWLSTTALSTGVFYHIAITYDSALTTNDPILYINGVVDTLTEDSTPVGASATDAAQNLLIGKGGDGFDDFDGLLQNVLYHNAILSAAEINQHMWHGRFPGVKVQHLLLTTKVTNEGSAVADLTFTGTTMASLPKTSRPGCGVF